MRLMALQILCVAVTGIISGVKGGFDIAVGSRQGRAGTESVRGGGSVNAWVSRRAVCSRDLLKRKRLL